MFLRERFYTNTTLKPKTTFSRKTQNKNEEISLRYTKIGVYTSIFFSGIATWLAYQAQVQAVQIQNFDLLLKNGTVQTQKMQQELDEITNQTVILNNQNLSIVEQLKISRAQRQRDIKADSLVDVGNVAILNRTIIGLETLCNKDPTKLISEQLVYITKDAKDLFESQLNNSFLIKNSALNDKWHSMYYKTYIANRKFDDFIHDRYSLRSITDLAAQKKENLAEFQFWSESLEQFCIHFKAVKNSK
jgi:hypothetical protein